MRCDYCGYQGRDQGEHREIHALLDELMESAMSEVRFRQLWASLAVKLDWPFTCYGRDGRGHVPDWVSAWRGWAKPRMAITL